MITFVVTIQEQADGKVGVHCETPPSQATPRETDAGMEFKAGFAKWLVGVRDRDWKHLARPGAN